MSARVRQALPPTAQWSDLTAELDRWGEAGRIATLWWRDDDAAKPDARLDRMLSVAGPIPLALAVIPASAAPSLAAALARLPRHQILQHGWRHWNYATNGKKSEFPAGRERQRVAADLAAGRERLQALFGERALAVLAPPWNRFDTGFLPLLATAGIAALSRSQPRPAGPPAPAIAERDVHVDLVAWHNGRGFIGAGSALAALVGHLRTRRLGMAADEATGILTHHLVADEATHGFLQQLAGATLAHPAARWLNGAEVFGRA